jgi:hypothetical protein
MSEAPGPVESARVASARVDRFVVGTGRCGSTLLTKMLDSHRDLLGLNEVFTGLDWGVRFTPDAVTGAEVAAILATPNPVIQMVTARGHEAEEVTYRFGPGDRYRRGDPLPWILTSTLGHLSDHPDAHWDALAAWLSARPAGPVAGHYRALFAHLAAEAGASAWVERSGSSIDYVGDLLDCFAAAPAGTSAVAVGTSAVPAKVLHIHRDGAEVALSMRNHAFYRLAVQLFYGVMPEGVDPDDEEAVVDGWLGGDPPIGLYGRYWSEQLAHGEATLAGLGADRLRTVGFEDLVAGPAPVMAELAGFLELSDDPGFPTRAAALVRGVPPSRLGDLDPSERSALDEACAPGRAVLARLGVG